MPAYAANLFFLLFSFFPLCLPKKIVRPLTTTSNGSQPTTYSMSYNDAMANSKERKKERNPAGKGLL